MPEWTEAELKKKTDQQEFARFYFLYGDEKFLLKQAAQRLVRKAAGDRFLDFNLQTFDGSTASASAIAAAAEALPFFAERKCVAVSDWDAEAKGAQEEKELETLLKTLPETTVLVLYLPTVEINLKKPGKWKALLSLAKSEGASVCFARKTERELQKILCAAAAKRGCTLSRQDAEYLVFLCGRELQTLHQELEKLCAFVKEGEITRKTIDLVAVRNMETTVFLLAKALVAGDSEKSYRLLDLLFYQKEEPIALLAALSAQYLDLYRVKAALQSGGTASDPSSCFASTYKGKEFRLQNAERDGKRLSLDALRESLSILLETDLALKGSRTEERVLLEEAIAKLLLAAKKEG